MKISHLLFIALQAIQLTASLTAKAQNLGPVRDTVIMGPSYANEVYYSMANGKQGAVARAQWDIAFRTAILSASIITNDGAGVVLYTYPKDDASGWATVDTAGLSTWKPQYNSLKDWETGAFNIYSQGQMDYGWGVYNLVTHNLVGDSIYVIKLRNGSLRKLWIESKASALNTYTFRYAAIDGSGEQEVTLDNGPYTAKNFIGYSLSDNKTVDFEPASGASWDLLFTKYMGISGTTPYLVTGVLSNYKTGVANYKHVAPGFANCDPAAIKQEREGVGYLWKTFTGGAYSIVDSNVFFVQDRDNRLYKLVFKEFAGSATGRIVFEKELLGTVSVASRMNATMNAAVYPNPVGRVMNLVLNPGNAGEAHVTIVNAAGRTVFSASFKLAQQTLTTLPVAIPELANGIYLVNIKAGAAQVTRKIAVNN